MGHNQEAKAQWQKDAQAAAFKLKKEGVCTSIGAAYNEVARTQGFKSWNHMCAAMKGKP